MSSFIKLKELECFPHSAPSQGLIPFQPSGNSCSSSTKRRAHLESRRPKRKGHNSSPGTKDKGTTPVQQLWRPKKLQSIGDGAEPHPGAAGEEGAEPGLGWRSRWTPGAVGTDRALLEGKEERKRKRRNVLTTAKTRSNQFMMPGSKTKSS